MRVIHRGPLGAGLALLLAVTASAQDAASTRSLAEQGVELLRQKRPAEAEQLFLRLVELDTGSADAHYYLALSRSLQGRFDDARAGFAQVLRLDPRRADACFEIAGTYIKTKEYPAALSWAERGHRFSPADEYGMDLVGTIHFLLDSKIEALRCWNRLNRPHLTELQISSTGAASRQRIAEEIHLLPGDLLSAREIEAARWRLRQHRCIRATRFLPVPGPTSDQYALEVNADARRGVGSRPEFLFNTFSNIGFRTWHFTYWDIAGYGVTSDLLWRWRTDAQLVQMDFDMPRPGHLPFYACASYGWRDESWYLSGDPKQYEPDFRLRTHEAGMRVLVPLRVPQLSLAAAVVTRQRRFDSLHMERAAARDGGTGSKTVGATGLQDSMSQLDTARSVAWLRLTPVLQLHGRAAQSAAGMESRIRAGLGLGRARNPVSEGLSRLSVSWENRIDSTSRSKLQRTLLLGLHAGRISEPGLAEDHYILGVGPDADFWLRAHPFLREGKPGQAPLAAEFALGNLTVATDIKSWKWIKVGMLAFLDLARLPRLYPGQKIPRTPADVGIGIELGSPLVASRRFTFTWGHDARTGRDVFYLATSFR